MSLKSIIRGESKKSPTEKAIEKLQARVERLEEERSEDQDGSDVESAIRAGMDQARSRPDVGAGGPHPATVVEEHIRIGEIDGAELWRDPGTGMYFITSEPLRHQGGEHDSVLVTPASLLELYILADKDRDRAGEDVADGDEVGR